MRSRTGSENTTRIIRENILQLNGDHDILAFLRRTVHLNNGCFLVKLNHILDIFFYNKITNSPLRANNRAY